MSCVPSRLLRLERHHTCLCHVMCHVTGHVTRHITSHVTRHVTRHVTSRHTSRHASRHARYDWIDTPHTYVMSCVTSNIMSRHESHHVTRHITLLRVIYRNKHSTALNRQTCDKALYWPDPRLGNNTIYQMLTYLGPLFQRFIRLVLKWLQNKCPFSVTASASVQCSAVQCSAVQCSAARCVGSAGPISCAANHNKAIYHCTALHCTALHCTALHCTALHGTARHCTALYYITRLQDITPASRLLSNVWILRRPTCRALT
jgi:hypothetical protein